MNATLIFRIEPGLKETLRYAAAQERRRIANRIEVIIRDYCGRNGNTIQEQRWFCPEVDREP